MRVSVRVHPGSPRPQVGGRYGTADPPVLVVRVTAPATEGRANRAVADAVAGAFGVKRKDVTVLSGARSRNKVLDVAGASPAVLARLLAGGAA
ncbi:MAG TPA: DUF167 domain-containing protein [Acidimicrobiales bacterium]|jgi:hypothetical protein|nr:DUF167 domain-containing protein [Acidimicrobiales bacterium]